MLIREKHCSRKPALQTFSMIMASITDTLNNLKIGDLWELRNFSV